MLDSGAKLSKSGDTSARESGVLREAGQGRCHHRVPGTLFRAQSRRSAAFSLGRLWRRFAATPPAGGWSVGHPPTPALGGACDPLGDTHSCRRGRGHDIRVDSTPPARGRRSGRRWRPGRRGATTVPRAKVGRMDMAAGAFRTTAHHRRTRVAVRLARAALTPDPSPFYRWFESGEPDEEAR